MPKTLKKITLKDSHQKPDYFLMILVLLLTFFGVIIVGNASVVEAFRDFSDKFHYLKLQAQWAGVGFLVFWLASLIHYRFYQTMAVPLMLLAIVFLILVLIPGLGTQALGARRWLGFGAFNFQPSELAKFGLAVYLAAFLSQKKQFWPFFLTMILLIGLVMLQPDLGTTVVLAATGGIIYFASGSPLWQILILSLLGLSTGTGLIFSSEYRKQRFLTFLNPDLDPLGRSYHIRQILLALGSGGLWGVGLGQSRQKYEYLPEAATDSIFAVIAEEAGLIGSLLVLLAFALLIWRGFRIARQAPDDFSRLLAVGLTAWLGLQALTNLAAMAALIPLTGIPLPFISYGGSSLVLALLSAGILLNISKHRVIKK